jgi:multiple sugar transport system permease protein
MASKTTVITESALEQNQNWLQRRLSTRQARKTMTFYAFISPWLLGLILLTILPLGVGLITSMTNYDGLNIDTVKWVGFDNYERILQDRTAERAIQTTVRFVGVNVPLWLVLSFGLALLLDQSIRARGIFRTLFYLPSIVPIVATAWTWRMVLAKNGGLLNGILSFLEPGKALNWLSGDQVFWSVTAVAVWTGLGGGMVIFLAGLQNIPDELKEAARLDGAGYWRIIRHVTIPLMTPLIFFQLVLGLIGAFNQFLVPLLLAGNPGDAGLGRRPSQDSYLYMIHTFRQIFTYGRFGYGIALLMVILLVIIVLTIVIFGSARFWVYYEPNDRA